MDTTFAAGMVSDETSERVPLGSRFPIETPVATRSVDLGHGAGRDVPTGREPLETPKADTGHSASELIPEVPRYKATEASLARANSRLPIVREFDELLRQGHSQAYAHHHLARVGMSVPLPTLRAWWLAYREHGYQGLMGQSHKAGRPSAVRRLVAAVGEEQAVELIKTARATAHDTQSAVLAARFVGRSETAPAAFADMIDYTESGKPRRSKHNLPKSFRDQIRINKAIALKHQGNRAADLRGLSTPRRVDVLPGDIFTSDDTTPIWGWWTPWEHALGNPAYDKASCEYRFGVKLMQGQLLPVMDFASNYVFMVALIARETSAYRAEDIAALYGRVFARHGLPRIGFQFERGTWESNILMGVNVDVQEGDLTLSHRVGGLQMLPTRITDAHRAMHGAEFPFPKNLQIFQSFLPKTKPIESAFDRLQSVEGMIYGNLGRDQMRRPNERAKKQFESCKRGAADPRLHFLRDTELLARLTPLYDFVNTERMEGQVFNGVPKLLWESALREHPLYQLPEESQYLFRRNWQVARVTRGMIGLKRKDAFDNTNTCYYCHPETFLGIEGRQVLAYWDHQDVESPAQIHDVETRQLLCVADYQPRVGTFFDVSTDGHDTKKRYKNAVTTHYADIGSRAPSRQLPQEIADRRAAAASPAATPPTPGRATAAPVTAAGDEPSVRSNLAAYGASEPAAAPMRAAGNTPFAALNSAASDPRMAEFLGMEE